jgi:hypothetical protein
MNDEPAAPGAVPAPRFLSDRPRFKAVALEWPIEYRGKTYSEIQLVRLTAGDVAAFYERLRGAPDGKLDWPIFRDADGAHLPDGLLDALDADDREALGKAQNDFLPRQFRGAASSASDPANGEPTA